MSSPCQLLAMLLLLGIACSLPAASAFALTRLPAPSRIVAIGDIHGDLNALTTCLEFSDLYSKAEDCWTGGDAVLVQTGDVLDRGTDEPAILELLKKLKLQAPDAGGKVITLLGNHEYLNCIGDMSFVEDRKCFGEDRIEAFRPGSPLARELAEWPVVAVVGNTVFCHAGLTLKHATRADAINRRAAKWLRGEDGPLTRKVRLERKKGRFYTKTVPESRPPTELREGTPSPLFTRQFANLNSYSPDSRMRNELWQVLRVLNASRLVVGHDIEPAIASDPEGLIFKIDIGMSSAIYDRAGETLEIVGNEVFILRKGERIPAKERARR